MRAAEFICRPLMLNDADQLATMLSSQPVEYMQYFTPFAFDRAVIMDILNSIRQDVYIGFFWANELIAFFMLRGWDSGYDVPAYGVTVDYRYHNKGLGRLTLEMSKSICRLRGAERLMLKVYPENVAAKHLYESVGFVQTGVDSKNHNLIFHFELNP